MNCRVRYPSAWSMLALLALVLALPCGASTKHAQDEGRAEVRQMAHEALAKLYQTQPSAKAALDGAAGYAVFRNFDLKMFVVGGGKGVGLALNNKNKKVTFMRMAELQAGLGLGKVYLIWVFENKKAFDHFVKSGFELGAQASEAAKAADSGSAFQGAVPVADGIWLYQLGDHGLAPELTVKGTKYYKDKDLN